MLFRSSPNGEKLKDGAIQRLSVQPSNEQLMFVSQNPKGIGVYKRPDMSCLAGNSGYFYSSPWDGTHNRYRVARIYMPQKKHVHNHPSNKTYGNYWVIDFEAPTYRSPLMGWGRASLDAFSNLKSNVTLEFARMSDAVEYA